MVSLINFKIVNEELQQPVQRSRQELERGNNDNRMFVKVSPHQNQEQHNDAQTTTINQQTIKQQLISSSQKQPKKSNNNNNSNESTNSSRSQTTTDHQRTNQVQLFKPNLNYSNQAANPNNASNEVSQMGAADAPNFVVTWRNLRFAIEPKWHQKVVNPVSSIAGRTSSVNRLANIGGGQNALSASLPPQSKVVLDKLDGSFKSGELTAILGPSGKFESQIKSFFRFGVF